MDKIQLVDVGSIIPNKLKLSIYKVPENYDEIVSNISEVGIVEPLILNSENVIISGNLRLQIALELGIMKVPVIYQDVPEELMDIVAISTNQHRIKSYSEILKEIQFFESKFNIKQGSRTDLNPQAKKIKDEIFAGIGVNTKKKLKIIDKIAKEIYGDNSFEYKRTWLNLDSGKQSLDGVYQHLLDQKKKIHNKSVVPEKYTINKKNYKIFNHSSEDMSELETGSIDSIITSPPYFQMVSYGNVNELGQEKEVDTYIENLLNIFSECYRILKDTGSCFVNINDCVSDSRYQLVPYKFVIGMVKQGWLLNDQLIWIKTNPTYTRGKRSVRSHEEIYHFTKSTEFYYDDSWLKRLIDVENAISYGTKKTSPKLKSGLDFRNNILITNVSSTQELRKKALNEGFHLTHKATFPEDIVEVCGNLSTKPMDKIVDPFSGTSVTGQWCRDNFRKYFGFEVNPQFVMAAEIRYKESLSWDEKVLMRLEESRQEWLRKRKKSQNTLNQ